MRKHGWQPGSVPHRSQSLLDLPSGSSSSPCSLVLFLFGRQDLAAQPGLTSDPRVSCLCLSGAAMAGVSYHTWFEFPGSALHGLQSQATPFLWWPVKRSVAPKKTEETFELPSKEVCPLGAPPRLSQARHLQVTLLERASLLLEGCCSPGFSGAARPPSPDIPPPQLSPLPQAKLVFIDLAFLSKSLSFYVTEIYSERKPQITMRKKKKPVPPAIVTENWCRM